MQSEVKIKVPILAQAYICTNSIANLPLLKQPQNLYKFPALECPSCKFACICMHFTSETTTLGPRTQPKNDSYMRQEPISPQGAHCSTA